MAKLVCNVLFVLMFWAQLFVVAYAFLGLTWACAAMLPFTFLGWAWCTPLDKKHATPTETTGPESIQVVDGDPENN